jgi:lipopolysaccharide heptosyltransferase I
MVGPRPPLAAYEPGRIALLKPSALGDIVHSLPVLTALRRRFPQAHITWVVNRSYEPLLTGHRDLDATLAFDRGAARRGWWAAAKAWASFLRRLRREQFDMVVDLQGLFRSGMMALASRAPRRVGLSSSREGAAWFYTDVVPVADPNALHAVERYWQAALAVGACDSGPQFHVPLRPEARRWADAMLAGCARPLLALGPGSRWVTKRWPPASFADLARRFQAEFGGTVVLVGGPEEAALGHAVGRRLDGPSRDLVGRTTLPQLAAVLARADIMLANDTGPLHLAAALGRPVVAPYTCTKVRLNGPFGRAEGAVESRVWCQGSYLKRCPRLECMEELTPDRLWPRLRDALLSCPPQTLPA